MKINIKNITKIKDISLEINGITVITGMNDSGKSTIGKLLFTALNSVNLANNKQQLPSCITSSFLDEYSSEDFCDASDDDKIHYCQDLQKDSNLPIEIEVIDEKNSFIKISIQNKNIIATHSGKLRFPIFLFDPINVDLYKTHYKNRKSNLINSISVASTIEPNKQLIIDNLIEKLQNILPGKLLVTGEHIAFKKNEKVHSLISASSGARILKLIEALLEKNSLNENTILIIDEPEMYLHPKLQLSLSEILVDISKKLNCQILLITHSPYILDGINSFAKYKKFDNVNFYMTNEENKVITLTNHTKDISPIIEALSKPLEILENLNFDNEP